MRRALTLSLLATVACQEPASEAPEPSETATTETATEAETSSEATSEEPSGPPGAGPIPETWVTERVNEARERMNGSEGGRLVWEAIEAHGGLPGWLSQGTIAFEFDYQPLGAPERRMHTHQRIDLWRARAVHRELDGGADPEAHFGWDGETAWIEPGPEAFPSPARFWALTPYYFVGMPFVVADPGTQYERLEDAELDGETHQLVKITYEPGTGDSPEDYYVLYLHPETHRLAALRYVVAYPGFFPEGGHTPEKLMRYTDFREVDGLQIAHTLDTYAWDAEAGEPGEKVTEVAVRTVGFGGNIPAEAFAKPEGAQVIAIEDAPRR